MPEEPIIPSMLAEQVVLGEMAEWIDGVAGQFADRTIDCEGKPLIPALERPIAPGVPGNETLESCGEPFSRQETTHVRLRLWFSGEDDYSSEAVESVFHSLRWLPHGLIFTCCGNQTRIVHMLTVHRGDEVAVASVFRSAFPKIHIEDESAAKTLGALDAHSKNHFLYRSMLAPRPFWGMFSSGSVEINTLYPALCALGRDAFGVYQIVLSPVSVRWTDAIRTMAKAEMLSAQRSMAARTSSMREDAVRLVQEKVRGPLFAAAVRVGVVSPDEPHGEAAMRTLLTTIAGIGFSGGVTEFVSEEDLLAVGVLPEDLSRSFLDGKSFHSGCVLSPSEISLFVRLPSVAEISNGCLPLARVPTVLAGLDKEKGVFLANEIAFGKEVAVIWPHRKRSQHMIVSGATGSGKTLLIAGTFARSLNENPREGMAVIDPHEKAIEGIACSLDERRLDDVILPDITDSQHVFCLPLMDCDDAGQIDAATANISRQIFALFSRTDMGFNIQTGMSNCVRTVLSCSSLSFLDVRRLTRPDRKGSDFREEVCASLKDEILIDYWTNEFESLDRGSVARIRSRIDTILRDTVLRHLLANKIRKVSYPQILEDGLILLANTSPGAVGPNVTAIFGGLCLTGHCSAAYSRTGTEGKRPVFTILAEEFGNYADARTMPHALRTLRKFDVSLVLVTQNVESLSVEMKAALSNIDAHVVLNQGWDDAHRYFKTFCGMVSTEQLMMRGVGEGYVKIGKSLASIKSPYRHHQVNAARLRDLRQQTIERYCIPTQEFQERMIDEHNVAIEDMKELDLI